MHRYRAALREAVSGESKAYGFTLVVWTTGALVADERGMPGRLDAVGYLGGILAAMAIVVLVSFGGLTTEWRVRTHSRLAFGAIHLASVPAAVASGWAVASAAGPPALAFSLAGFVAALVYQFLLGLEVMVSLTNDSS